MSKGWSGGKVSRIQRVSFKPEGFVPMEFIRFNYKQIIKTNEKLTTRIET
jgi:hypothetical protein